MRIGILGSGDVGKALAVGFLASGHEVMVGSRDAAKLEEWRKTTAPKATLGSFAQTAAFGDVVVLATVWNGTESAIKLAGVDALRGKTVIDVTNPLVFAEGKPPALALGHHDSGGEQVQRWLPGSHVVKAFNIVGNAHMYKPDFPGGPPTMFLCGNDAEAKRVVTSFLDAFGWEAIDIGGIEGSRLLEPMCILWVQYALQGGGWNHAFKLLRK